MADFNVLMSPDEIPDDILREAIARGLRGGVGREVEAAGHAVSLLIEGIDWWEVANADETLIEAEWDDNDQIEGLVAFDFGTREWFVLQVDLLGRQTLVAIVPTSDCDTEFRQMVRGWIWRNGWTHGRFPSVIRSPFTDEAWLARELATTLRGNEAAMATHLAACDVAEEGDPAEALEHWDHAVMVTGDAPAIDLFEWDAQGEEGAFATWLDEVDVVWDDTGVEVAPEDALRLWLVCQYLALP